MSRMGRIDEALAKRAAAGDEKSFEALVHRHTQAIWRVAFCVTGNRHDVDDVFQETLVHLWRRLASFRGECDFRTWLTRIVINCAIDLLRRRERERLADSAARALAPIDTNPEVLACASETERAIQRVIEEELTQAERTAFTLRHMSGLGIREISERMGLPETAVRRAVYRAMLKLKEVTHASDQRTSDRLRFRR
jgi:RNA polymerase sigma-70 factor (ECF subfamily)